MYQWGSRYKKTATVLAEPSRSTIPEPVEGRLLSGVEALRSLLPSKPIETARYICGIQGSKSTQS